MFVESSEIRINTVSYITMFLNTELTLLQFGIAGKILKKY